MLPFLKKIKKMYVMSSTYCVCMFLCSLYAPTHQNKFQVGVNLLGNKYYSDSDSDWFRYRVIQLCHDTILVISRSPISVLWP